MQFDASAFATGSYPYQLLVTNHFGAAAITGVQADTVLVNNEAASPFGAGWTLDGLQRLHNVGLAGVVLTEGDGSILHFRPGFLADGGFGPPASFGQVVEARAHAIDDFNNDGALDLAVPGETAGKVFILLNDGAGGFPTIREVTVGVPGGGNLSSVATGDFNNDGLRDLAVANNGIDTVSIHLGTGNGFFAAPLQLGAGSTHTVAVADFNKDGFDDVVSGELGFFDRVRVFFGDGAGGFSPAVLIGNVGNQPNSLLAGDLNGDGNPDIAVTALNNLAVLFGDGNGGFAVTNFDAGAVTSGAARWGVAAADFDQDGVLDLVVANFAASTVSVLQGKCRSRRTPRRTCRGQAPLAIGRCRAPRRVTPRPGDSRLRRRPIWRRGGAPCSTSLG